MANVSAVTSGRNSPRSAAAVRAERSERRGARSRRRVREERSIQWTQVRHEIRDALPVGTAATVPAAILLLAWTGLVDTRLVLTLAIIVTDVRLALLGSALEWFSGERSSARLFLAGAGTGARLGHHSRAQVGNHALSGTAEGLPKGS
jgi:hypothetical protein